MRTASCLLVLFFAAQAVPGMAEDRLYWTDKGSVPPRIQRSALDGSAVTGVVTQGLSDPRGIAVDLCGSKLYWADYLAGRIQSSNLDGGDIQDVITGLSSPAGIALDLEGGCIYWADSGSSRIRRAKLDGSEATNVVSSGLVEPYFVAVESAGRKLYWTDPGTGKIQRSNLDGSQVEDLVTAAIGNTLRGIAVDAIHGKIYWADRNVKLIQRANLDGSAVETLVSTGLDRPHGVALDIKRGRVFWADTTLARIPSSNLDGSSVSNVVASGLTSPWGVALLLDDADADELPDQWEMLHFHSLTNSSGGQSDDRDQDGFCDLREYIAGTDPTNRASRLAVSIAVGQPGEVVLSWPGATGRMYRISSSGILAGGDTNWSDLPEVSGKAGVMACTSAVPSTNCMFYRAAVRIAP